MNPQYLTGRLPPVVGQQASRWPVRVPRSTGKKIAVSLLDNSARKAYESYAVRVGDTLETIARRRKIAVEQLAALNSLSVSDNVASGSVLLVPRFQEGQIAERDAEEVVVVPATQFQLPGRARVFYRVLATDSLEALATALGVSSEELVVWNELDRSAKLQSGMIIQAFVTKERELNNVRVVAERDTKVLLAGSSEFLDYFEAQKGRKRITVRAKSGDTLAKIGARYSLSVGMMERINRCARTRVLTPGEAVVVYAQRGSSEVAKVSGRPLARIDAPRPDLLPKSKDIE
jgi:membrane-bound lytic murein transglycosylase D